MDLRRSQQRSYQAFSVAKFFHRSPRVAVRNQHLEASSFRFRIAAKHPGVRRRGWLAEPIHPQGSLFKKACSDGLLRESTFAHACFSGVWLDVCPAQKCTERLGAGHFRLGNLEGQDMTVLPFEACPK